MNQWLSFGKMILKYHPFCFLLPLLLIVSCSQDSVDFEILPEEKMREILVDLHLHEAAAETIGKGHPDSVRNEMLLVYEYVFNKHEVDKELFFKNFEYYVFNKIDLLDALYQSVIEDLNIKDAEARIKRPEKSHDEEEED